MLLTEIDKANVDDHFHLKPLINGGVKCYFLREYAAGRGYAFSESNQLIFNLKREMSYRARPDVWRHKEAAIATCSNDLRSALRAGWLNVATLVPIPPSKCKDHPEYDDRMTRVLKGIRVSPPLDIRELIRQKVSTDPEHTAIERGVPRRNPSQIRANYEIDETLVSPDPSYIGLFDDILTAGSHFSAAHQLLSKRFPSAKFCGIFISRRVTEIPDDAISDSD